MIFGRPAITNPVSAAIRAYRTNDSDSNWAWQLTTSPSSSYNRSIISYNCDNLVTKPLDNSIKYLYIVLSILPYYANVLRL